MPLIGRRVHGKEPHQFEPNDYGFCEGQDCWCACTPNDLLANLANHTVTEHEDGTITVAPSILCTDGAGGHRWHGFIEKGVWREA